MSTNHETKITEGRCGASLTTFSGLPPVSCALPYGHKSAWHRSNEGTEWGPITPQHTWGGEDFAADPPEEDSVRYYSRAEVDAAFAAGVQAGREAAAAEAKAQAEEFAATACCKGRGECGLGDCFQDETVVLTLQDIADRIARGDTQEERDG